MLTTAHKSLLADLARRHYADLHDQLRLARAHFSDSSFTVRSLSERVRAAENVVKAIESEPARQVA